MSCQQCGCGSSSSPLKAWGNVISLGLRTTGQGFDAVRIVVGTYEVTLTTPSVGIVPTVNITPFNEAPFLSKTATYEFNSPTIVTVFIKDSTLNTLVDSGFAFSAFYTGC